MGNGESNHVSLHKFVERIFDEREKQFELRFAAEKTARELAADSLSHRLETLNKLRDEVVQDRANYITQEKFDLIIKTLITRLDEYGNFKSRLVGMGIVLGLVAGAVGGIIGHLLK